MEFLRHANHYEYIIDTKCGESIDCFFAFVRWDNAFWSVHRRHVMFQPDAWPETFDDYVSDILVTQWRETPLGHLEVCEQSVIGQGNDPRITMVAGRPIALFRGAIHCEHEMYLYDFKAQKLTPVIVDEPMFSYGKNWMPFEFEGKLRAVHSLTPFHLPEIDIETGVGRTVLTAAQPFSPRVQNDNLAILRGGDNPIQFSGILLDAA